MQKRSVSGFDRRSKLPHLRSAYNCSFGDLEEQGVDAWCGEIRKTRRAHIREGRLIKGISGDLSMPRSASTISTPKGAHVLRPLAQARIAGSDPASRKAPASKSSKADKDGRYAAGRMRPPTLCSPSNAASKTFAGRDSRQGQQIVFQLLPVFLMHEAQIYQVIHHGNPADAQTFRHFVYTFRCGDRSRQFLQRLFQQGGRH